MMERPWYFVKPSPDDPGELYEMDITSVTALTEIEVRTILELLDEWGYQWPDDSVCWGGFEQDAIVAQRQRTPTATKMHREGRA